MTAVFLDLLKVFMALFLIGLLLDWPTRRRKKRHSNCEAGKHEFTPWQFEYTIGYNDKDVYRRHCKHCKVQQFTISRLYPDDEAVVYDKI